MNGDAHWWNGYIVKSVYKLFVVFSLQYSNYPRCWYYIKIKCDMYKMYLIVSFWFSNLDFLFSVLLYPPDRPHSDQQKIRQPDSAPLHSRHMADPPKRPRTPIEVKHRDKLRRSKSGKLLIDSRHQYPMSKRVSDVGFKQSLSTGRAVIRRKTDCWMTFEEYEDLTR